VDEYYLALALITGTVLCTAIFSKALEKTLLQEPMLALGVGILGGPQVLGWIDVGLLQDPLRFLEEASRITLAIAVMGVALRLSRNEIVQYWAPATVFVTFGLTGMWLAAALLTLWILDVPFWVAMLVGATVAATDPVVATAIATGPIAQKMLPERIRATLSLETGANDGLAYLIVVLPILLLAHDPGRALTVWLLDTVLVGVLLAGALGTAVGYAAAKLLHWANERNLIEKYSYLTFTLAVSLFTLAIGHLTGAESLIAIFVAGLVFDMYSETSEQHDEENVQEAIGKLCTLPMFILFGAALPWDDWLVLGWPVAALCVAVLLLRRLPIALILLKLLRNRLTVPDAVFLGWFGPIGVAAIFYATYATRHTGLEQIWHVASALVLASVVVHGMTAAPFSRLYAYVSRSADTKNI
jgi:sodium/hydrogen antiporter